MREEINTYYEARSAVETFEEGFEGFHRFCAPDILDSELKDIRQYKELMEGIKSLVSLLEWQNERIEQLDDRVNNLMLERNKD